jgi:hypothetical protein
MQTKTKKHSKFKNGGMLFELLTRQITSDILAGRDEKFTKDLLFTYFNESKELGKEVQLYNFIVDQTVTSEQSASRVLEIIIQTRSKLNERELERQKYNLIKEIKEKYDINEFLKNKIPNYKLYASIYKIFENSISKDIKFKIPELMSAKDCIIESLVKSTKTNNEELNLYSEQSPDVKLIAYKFLIENFNAKYTDLLPRQKRLLKEYINSLTNTTQFTAHINTELKTVITELTGLISKVKSDVVQIKLKETINQLANKLAKKSVNDSHLNILMNGYELVEELRSIKGTI